jgi:hypothetical protein
VHGIKQYINTLKEDLKQMKMKKKLNPELIDKKKQVIKRIINDMKESFREIGNEIKK